MKRTLTVVAVLTLCLVVGSKLYFSSPNNTMGNVNATRILEAAESYSNELKSKGAPVPPTVSLKELLDQGLLAEKDLGMLADTEVTVSLSADWGRPQDIIIKAYLPDSQKIVALADGSVHQIRQ